MFVLRVYTYKARTMFTPRSRTQKTLWNLIKLSLRILGIHNI